MNMQLATFEACRYRFDRRGALKAAALAAAGLVAAPAGWLSTAAATHLRTRFRKNIRLGIASTVYAALPVADAAARIKADGFRSLLTNFQFADARFDPLKPDWAVFDRIAAALAKHDIAVASLYGYYNLVHPDQAKRQAGEARMEFLLTNWQRLGCPLVATETGTFNAKSEWLEAPENQTEEGYQKCKAALLRWVKVAERTGAVLTIETYWRNIIGTVERVERLLTEIDSPALKLVMDPCNFFAAADLKRMQPLLAAMFDRLGPRIAVAHAKDVALVGEATDTPAAGTGVLDYPYFLRRLSELNRPMDLLLEHVKLDDVARARDFVLGHVEKLP